MLQDITLPPDLNAAIGAENKDFVVKANRIQSLKKSISLILSGIFWLAFTSIFVFAFLGPIFQGKEVHFTANGIPTVAGPENLKPVILPALIIGIFVLAGMGILGLGLYFLFKKGAYFAGTPTRLIILQPSNIRSIDWEQFSGDLEISGNAQKGSIALQLRTGKMVGSGNEPSRYVQDVIYIADIPDIFTIEQICRKRIKENDPTPPNTIQNAVS